MLPSTDSTGAKAQKYRSITEIMASPSLKAKLQSYLDEAVKSKNNMDFERTQLKSIRDNAAEELQLKPIVFNQYVDMVYKNDYVQRRDKLEDLVEMIDVVMKVEKIEYNPEG